MNADIRRNLAMAVRALDFAQANPSTDPSYTGVVAQLQAQVALADSLVLEQREGTGNQHAAVDRRQEIEQHTLKPKLRHLIHVARVAIASHPELAGIFIAPPTAAPFKDFIMAVMSMLAAAVAQQELFVSLGLGSTFVSDLTAAVADFDQQTGDAHTGRRTHVSALTALKLAAAECLTLVTLLDGLNRDRFSGDPSTLAAWVSARNVIHGRRSKKAAPAEPPVDTPPQPVAAGEKPTPTAPGSDAKVA